MAAYIGRHRPSRRIAASVGLTVYLIGLSLSCSTPTPPPPVLVETLSIQDLYPEALQIAKAWKEDAYFTGADTSFRARCDGLCHSGSPWRAARARASTIQDTAAATTAARSARSISSNQLARPGRNTVVSPSVAETSASGFLRSPAPRGGLRRRVSSASSRAALRAESRYSSLGPR